MDARPDRAAADGPPVAVDAVAEELHRRLRAPFRVVALAPGTLPVAEHKTRTVYRTARGDTPPPGIDNDRPTRSPTP